MHLFHCKGTPFLYLLFINGTRFTYHVLMLILNFTVHQVLPIQSKRVTAFLQAKIHLNLGYLISGYKEWGGGVWGLGGVVVFILMKRGSSCSSGATHQIPSSHSSPPPPPLNNKMNRILLGYRSSERALDHEKFRAIKKKLSTRNKLTSSIHPSGLLGGPILNHITTSNWTQWYITWACIAFHFCH